MLIGVPVYVLRALLHALLLDSVVVWTVVSVVALYFTAAVF